MTHLGRFSPEHPEQRVTLSLQSPLMGCTPKNPLAVMSGQIKEMLVNNSNQIQKNGNKKQYTYQALQYNIKRGS